MSDLNPTSEAHTNEGTKPQQASLTDLLRVGPESRPTLLASTPDADDEGRAPDRSAASDATPAEPIGTDGASASPTVAAATVERGITAQRPRLGAWHAAGLSCAALGLLLAIAHLVAPRLVQGVESVGDYRVLSGGLIVGGLLAFAVGVLRRALREIQGSLDAVSIETMRLEEIARDGRAVLDTLHAVRTKNTTLTEDVGKLQERIKRLTEIVSSPDYTVSIFRLAASVDQLGKHVAAYMKEQFGVVQQRLAAGAQNAEHAQQQLKSALSQLHSLAKEQHRLQTLATQDAFEEVRTASERIAAHVQSQQEESTSGFASLSERSALHADQLASGLGELRGRLDRQAQDLAASLHARFEELDERIDVAQRNQATGVNQIAEHLEQQFARHVEEIQQSLKSISELASRGSQEISGEFDKLGAQFDQLERAQSAALQKTSQDAQQSTGATRRELAANHEQLKAHVEQQARDHLAALRKTSQDAQQAAAVARHEIAGSLEQLRSQLEQQSRDHLAALHETWQDAQQSSDAIRRELGASLVQTGSRIEESLAARSDVLAGELRSLSETVGSITTEVQRSISESAQQAAASRLDAEIPSVADASVPSAILPSALDALSFAPPDEAQSTGPTGTADG
jgi:hypothetical protein